MRVGDFKGVGHCKAKFLGWMVTFRVIIYRMSDGEWLYYKFSHKETL